VGCRFSVRSSFGLQLPFPAIKSVHFPRGAFRGEVRKRPVARSCCARRRLGPTLRGAACRPEGARILLPYPGLHLRRGRPCGSAALGCIRDIQDSSMSRFHGIWCMLRAADLEPAESRTSRACCNLHTPSERLFACTELTPARGGAHGLNTDGVTGGLMFDRDLLLPLFNLNTNFRHTNKH